MAFSLSGGIHRVHIFVSVILLLGSGLALTGCAKKTSEGGSAKASGKGRSETIPVVVAKAQKKDLQVTIDAIGAVESLRAVAVKSLVTGLLLKVNFQESHEVKQGDLLFEIDSRPFQIALKSAEADHQKTQAQLETAMAEVARYSNLLKQGMVSVEQFQNIQNNERTLKAQLLFNEAAIANAKLQMEYCSIKAPCSGRTGSLGAHEGDLVRASDANISLVTITQLSPVYVTFSVPQQNLAELKRLMTAGKPSVLANPSNSGSVQEKGELTFLDNAVDATTGTIKLKATFENTDQGLWPGQFAMVRVNMGVLPDQVIVPSTALQNGQSGPQAFVVKADKTVELRQVTVGKSVGLETAVLKGLNAGETVVIDGQIKLKSGTTVDIKPAVVDVPFTMASEAAEQSAGANKKAPAAGKQEMAP